MNDLSTAINRGEGGLKENPPCTPLKENKGTSIFSVPVPIARTYAPAQGTPTPERTGSGSGAGTGTPSLRTGTGTVCLRSSGTGTGTVRRSITIDNELILHGYNEQGLRYDAVQTALYVLGIPLYSNGYNNAKVLRYHLRRLGEDTFRQLVYDQWRENDIDGSPRSVISALIARLWKVGGPK